MSDGQLGRAGYALKVVPAAYYDVLRLKSVYIQSDTVRLYPEHYQRISAHTHTYGTLSNACTAAQL